MKKYEIVADAISEEIRTGHYPDGALLPTEEKLTEKYGVSRQTILSLSADETYISTPHIWIFWFLESICE